MVAQNGIAAFVTWYERPSSPSWILSDVFGTAPTELTRSISLQKALQLIRIVVEVVEDQVPVIAPEADQPSLREAVLRYSREVAFAAADVYARAAESRGSWDTRLEALIVDAILRGENTDALRSRIAALGWKAQERFTVMVGNSPSEPSASYVSELRRTGRPLCRGRARGHPGRPADPDPRRRPGPGNGLPEAQRDVRARARGLRPRGRFPAGGQRLGAVGLRRADRSPGLAFRPAARWPPTTCSPNGSSPATTPRAGRWSRTSTGRSLAASNGLVETLGTYLELGHSLEATARELFVHANTVRYRLKRVCDVTGWDPLLPREAFVLQAALVVGRLSAPPKAPRGAPSGAESDLSRCRLPTT